MHRVIVIPLSGNAHTLTLAADANTIGDAKALYSSEVGVRTAHLVWRSADKGKELPDTATFGDDDVTTVYSETVCTPFDSLLALEANLKGDKLLLYAITMLWRHCADVPLDDDRGGCLFSIPPSIRNGGNALQIEDCKRDRALLRKKQAYFWGIEYELCDYYDYERPGGFQTFEGHYDTSTGYCTCLCQYCNAAQWESQEDWNENVHFQDNERCQLCKRYDKQQGVIIPFVTQAIHLISKLSPDYRSEYTRAELREWIVMHGIADQLPLSACGFELKEEDGYYTWEAPPEIPRDTLASRLQYGDTLSWN